MEPERAAITKRTAVLGVLSAFIFIFSSSFRISFSVLVTQASLVWKKPLAMNQFFLELLVVTTMCGAAAVVRAEKEVVSPLTDDAEVVDMDLTE